MAKALVIGKSGQLAKALASAPDHGFKLSFASRAEADLTDPDSLTRTMLRHRPELVINAAAYTAVDLAESEPVQAIATNGGGVRTLASLCAEQDIPLVHISTDYVFDGSKVDPYVEDDPVEPLGVYGRSKLVGEQAVREICPRHLILRTSWVYSPWGHNFVRTMLRLAKDMDEINVVADQIGSPTYAPHLAQAILDLAWQAGQVGDEVWGTYHVSGAGHVSWADFAREIFRISKELGGPFATVHDITTSDYPTPVQRPANSVLSGRKLSCSLGHTQPRWQSGAHECIRLILNAQTSRT